MKLRTDDVTWRRVEQDVILLDLRRSMYLRLNPAGAVLWEQLVEGQDESGLIGALIEIFNVSSERATEEVRAFLDQLREAELIS